MVNKKLEPSFRDLAQGMLDFPAGAEVVAELREKFPELEEQSEISNRKAMLYSQLGKALKGDARAFELIREIAGEKNMGKAEALKLEQTPFEIKIIK